MKELITIERHILQQQQEGFPQATGDFTQLLYDITFAAKIIAREVNKAGLMDILGSTGTENIQGETVQKLDEFANSVIQNTMDKTGRVSVMASEEEAEIIHIPKKHKVGKYVLLFDPLDGSSNIDANVSIGSIFTIFRRISPHGGPGRLEDFLQPGREMVAAGDIIYGSSTTMGWSRRSRAASFSDRKSTRLNSSHTDISRMPSSA